MPNTQSVAYKIITLMTKIGFSLLMFLFLFISTASNAQKMVAFDKRGKVKRVRFFHGDFLKLQLLNGTFIEGEIIEILTDTFKIGKNSIPLDSVKFVYLSKGKQLLNTASGFLITGGLAYPPLVTFNRAVNDDSPLVKKSTVIISGGMLLGGVLLKSLNSRKFRISKKRPLKIIDLSP